MTQGRLMGPPSMGGSMDTTVTDSQFAENVRQGLSANPKYLMSRYFYDARGDEIFQAIMASPEYYLTDCELEILSTQGADIAAALPGRGPLELIELGSGDGQKIGHLLDALHAAGREFVFRPVDISLNSLDLLEDAVRPGRPWLKMDPVHANYFRWLDGLAPAAGSRVIAFMGSNLGNFGEDGSLDFLRLLRSSLGTGDALLIGLDLKKTPAVIEAAYNDAAGHTRAFNLNLLHRINRELGGEFDPDRFSHQPEYNPDTGAAQSFLRSEAAQEVFIRATGETFTFAEGERIHMENSQKYDEAMIAGLSRRAGFHVAHRFTDTRDWYTDQVWTPMSD